MVRGWRTNVLHLMLQRRSPLKILALLCFVALCAPLAQAEIFGFGCITNNGNGCVALAPQLTVEVTNPGGGQVLFTFRNAGIIASSIADVYFDDGTLLGIATIIDGPGVIFY